KQLDRIRKHDTSNSSGNDVDADGADNPNNVYDEAAKWLRIQVTVEINVLATRQQHTEQPEFNNE
ncbi:hypothetical protein Tco_0811787, partial [Tanacetum coccineum]